MSVIFDLDHINRVWKHGGTPFTKKFPFNKVPIEATMLPNGREVSDLPTLKSALMDDQKQSSRASATD